jgi:hypothetical protein
LPPPPPPTGALVPPPGTLASVTTLTFDGDQLTGVTYAEPAASALLGPEPGPAEGLHPDREAQ